MHMLHSEGGKTGSKIPDLQLPLRLTRSVPRPRHCVPSARRSGFTSLSSFIETGQIFYTTQSSGMCDRCRGKSGASTQLRRGMAGKLSEARSAMQLSSSDAAASTIRTSINKRLPLSAAPLDARVSGKTSISLSGCKGARLKHGAGRRFKPDRFQSLGATARITYAFSTISEAPFIARSPLSASSLPTDTFRSHGIQRDCCCLHVDLPLGNLVKASAALAKRLDYSRKCRLPPVEPLRPYYRFRNVREVKIAPAGGCEESSAETFPPRSKSGMLPGR